MAKEPNQARWFGVRPTDPEEPFTVKQGTYANLKATIIGDDAAALQVKQNTPSHLKSEVTPASAAEFYVFPQQPTGATQVATEQGAENGVTLLNETSSGKIFYLVAWNVTAKNAAGAIKTADIIVTNNADAIQYMVTHPFVADGEIVNLSGSFPVPLEVPDGWKLKVRSLAAGLEVSACILGYEA